MKNLKRLTKRGLSLFIALVMCMSAMSVTAFAEGEIIEPVLCETCGSPVHEGECETLPAICETCGQPAHEGECETEPAVCETCGKPAHEGECETEPAICETCGKPVHEGECETLPASLEDEAVVAFLAAVNALSELPEDAEAEAQLAAQKAVVSAYDALSVEQIALLDATRATDEGTYTQMVSALKEVVTLAESGETAMPFTVGSESYATLAEAVTNAPDGSTIYVTADVTMTECARFSGKSLTIIGESETTPVVTRGDNFITQSDSRSWYNPAMIEVNGSLRLENIVFDDASKAKGTIFKQAGSGDGNTTDNTTVVQDAIIASYDGTGTITLGAGAVLKNFGGMSAVRITGANGKLVMEDGSSIEGGGENSTKANGGTGAAGAVWIQNGTFQMDGGTISGVTGRAVYADGADSVVNIGGTISQVTASANMWQGVNGVAIHLRSNASATVSGTIKNVGSSETPQGIILFTEGCNFTLANGGAIKDCHAEKYE